MAIAMDNCSLVESVVILILTSTLKLPSGLNLASEILFIVDGGKGLSKGIKEVMGDRAVIQRCQWHKRENVVSYLDKAQQNSMRAKLQAA